MATPITNCYDPKAVCPRLPVERVFLYRPEREWTYSHHPSITFYKGRYYAIWSNGRVDEDTPGQRVLIASSADWSHWTEPAALVGPIQGDHSELVLTAAGFRQYAGTLAAYCAGYEYAAEAIRKGIQNGVGHEGIALWAMTTSDGSNWSGLRDMCMPIVPNHGPQRIASGTLIISGHTFFPYSNDPSGLSGWTMAGLYPPDLPLAVYAQSDRLRDTRARMSWPAGLCEGSFYQTDDGTIHMLLRLTGPNHAGKLWLTESRDDGATWSPPCQVEFTDNDTKFHFGRLPDGRFYYVGCPDPEPRGVRNPLVLSLSTDGARFDRHYILADEDYVQRRPGKHKGGLYGYPHTMVQDGHLHVIISLRKEAVAVLRVSLSALS
jgi:hypothetical protein